MRRISALMILAAALAAAQTTIGSLTFTNTPLIVTEGASELAVSIRSDGTVAVTGLGFLSLGAHLWTGPFGATPVFRGVLDALPEPPLIEFGGNDADVDFGSTGTPHATSLVALVNPGFRAPYGTFQRGISAISCPSPADLTQCTSQLIDTTTSDRPWITSAGRTVYISYTDRWKDSSDLIRVQRSDDDGLTWRLVGNPIVGHGSVTADAAFNNLLGPIVADASAGNVYQIYAAGEPGLQKAKTSAF